MYARQRQSTIDKNYDDLPPYIEHDPGYEKKVSLIKECQSLLDVNQQSTDVMHIAVIGPPGCGKSAFINTIFAAFSTSCWIDHAKSGVFESNETFTERLKRYEKVDYYRNNDTARMPTFADMTGFDDCQSEKTKELLRLIMAGNIKDNEHIAMLKEKSITELQKRRKNLGGSPRINRIIAVCSCDPDSNLPRSLFSAIIEIAKERDIPVYGVLTHADKFPVGREGRSSDKEKAFMKCLGLEKHRFARIVNYCPDVDPDMTYRDSINPTLDVPVLTFLKQVFTPDKSDSPELLPLSSWKDKTNTSLTIIGFIGVVCVIIAILWNAFLLREQTIS